MKDLFLKNSGDNTAIATLRVDLLSNAQTNMTVSEINLPNGTKADSILLAGGKLIQRKVHSLPNLITFCTANSITIVSSDTNGSNPVTLN